MIANLLIPAGKALCAYTAVQGTKMQHRGRIDVEQIGEDNWVWEDTVSWITGTVS